MTSTTGDQAPPAGWYPDKSVDAPAGQQRYWDGLNWTEHTTTAPTGAPGDQAAAVQQAPRGSLGLAAFVLGVIGLILAFIPLGFLGAGILGIIGLTLGFLGRGRANRGQATNGRSALWGIILSALAVAISVFGAARQFEDLSGELSGNTTVADLEVGDCIADIPEDKEVIYTVDTVSCSEPHSVEVYAIVGLPEGDFPGDEAVAARADEMCAVRFKSFVGLPYEESVLLLTSGYPYEEAWNAGDRMVRCMVFEEDGETTGTLADYNR